MTRSKKEYPLKYYPPFEEKLNVISHAIGIAGGVIALIMMLQKVWGKDATHIYAVLIYGISIITLYTASTLFHSCKAPRLRHRLNVFDHSAIYFLIAGTYTPYTLITLQGSTGWIVFAAIWTAALGGIILKLFFTGKYRILSTIMYVLMGWMVVFAIKPLYNNMELEGFVWLMAGGLAYTLGAVLYAVKKIPYNHAIFHVFVLVASICHFISIYKFVI